MAGPSGFAPFSSSVPEGAPRGLLGNPLVLKRAPEQTEEHVALRGIYLTTRGVGGLRRLSGVEGGLQESCRALRGAAVPLRSWSQSCVVPKQSRQGSLTEEIA